MEKKKARFNVVDAIIVAVVIAAVGIVGMKLFSDRASTETVSWYHVSFFCEDVPSHEAELIKKGNAVTDDDKKVSLGVVETVELGPSQNYVETAEGQLKLTSKEDANSVTLVARVSAKEFEHGITVGTTRYGVGHSLALRAGNTKVFGRVSGIEKIEE